MTLNDIGWHGTEYSLEYTEAMEIDIEKKFDMRHQKKNSTKPDPPSSSSSSSFAASTRIIISIAS